MRKKDFTDEGTCPHRHAHNHMHVPAHEHLHEHPKMIGFEIKTAAHMMKRKIDWRTQENDGEPMTPMHGWIIGYLHRNRGQKEIFQRDIEAEFLIRRSTATVILQLMEKNGMIVREAVPYDARLKKIVLTEQGIKRFEEVKTEIQKVETKLQNGLTQEEKNAFFAIMDKIKKNLE